MEGPPNLYHTPGRARFQGEDAVAACETGSSGVGANGSFQIKARARMRMEEKYLAAPNVIGVIVGR